MPISFPNHLILPTTFQINSPCHKPMQSLALSIFIHKILLKWEIWLIIIILFYFVLFLLDTIIVYFRKPDVRFKDWKNKRQHSEQSEFMFINISVLFQAKQYNGPSILFSDHWMIQIDSDVRNERWSSS